MATVKQTKALERLLTYCITQTDGNDKQQALELAKKKGYVNEDGKVIGVVSAVMRNFHHVVVSSTLKQIKTIIKSINE